MAGNGAIRTFQFSSASTRTLLTRETTVKASPFASKPTKLTSLSPSNTTPAFRFLSRSPVELGGAMSLMPLHSVTASALLTSLLSVRNRN